MPEGVREGILKGMYRSGSRSRRPEARAQLFGTGAILLEL